MHILSVRLPDVGEGVTEAELVEWHVQVGDLVREDDVLAAVMTDKATVEIPSLYTGKVTALGGQIGEVLAVGANLVLIETTDGLSDDEASRTPAAPSEEETFELKQSAKEPPTRAAPTTNASGRPIHARPPRPEGTEVLASPSVRARARDGGIDLRQVGGSGPAGRIIHSDLDVLFAVPADPSTQLGSGSARRVRTGVEEIKVVGMRRKIAERMAIANSRIPHITVVEEVDVTALEDLREKLNAGRGERPKLTVLPFVTAVLARAFIDHPEMNAHFDDDAGVVHRHEAAHLGIATMTDAGLVVPVFRHAEAAGLFETASEISRLSSVARNGKASRDELSGSTFTITSLGRLGAIATTPIINHPEIAILGINKMAVRPMWDGTQFQPRKMMNISASFDHRVIDGMDAALFVQKVKSLLETPALIFVDL
nr:dihydrolipoamide acetyltransferase family protein [Novosphingobium sp. P6W]KIS30166.1 branched-chain alpha-keto acid dehydrogenase subunit E2 [Novosphingobium sp. P6W]